MVNVVRSDPALRSRFRVDVVQPAVVLDVLLALQRTDASLGFRYSCRVAMCGTCGVRVDGRPVLACQTPAPSTGTGSCTGWTGGRCWGPSARGG